ncbi:hypothetical protein G6F68_016689 [Rhizopus microsporus]|nr:hypothetical protein G6F24_015107 [Rhizopus arrhizus]KAG1241479.1 hypothetical protein G6F68_016689 [Rhizopus microsporus]
MHDVEFPARQPIGPPREIQHAHPARQPAGKAHRQETERQVAVEVTRHDGDIVALAQDAHQLHAIGLRASEAIAEAVDQQRNAKPPLSGAGACLHTGSGTSAGSGRYWWNAPPSPGAVRTDRRTPPPGRAGSAWRCHSRPHAP